MELHKLMALSLGMKRLRFMGQKFEMIEHVYVVDLACPEVLRSSLMQAGLNY